MALSFVWCMCPSGFTHWRHQCCLYLGAPFLDAHFMGNYIIQECPLKPSVCSWTLKNTLFSSSPLSDCKYSYNQVNPSFWLCLCASTRLCHVYAFSAHWCKIRNISHRLTQIIKRQHDHISMTNTPSMHIIPVLYIYILHCKIFWSSGSRKFIISHVKNWGLSRDLCSYSEGFDMKLMWCECVTVNNIKN